MEECKMLVDVKELESEYFEMVVALGDIILLVEDLKKTTSDNERKAVIQNIEDTSDGFIKTKFPQKTYQSLAVTHLYGKDVINWQLAKKASHDFEQAVINEMHTAGLVGMTVEAKMLFIKMGYTLGVWKEMLHKKDIIKSKL